MLLLGDMKPAIFVALLAIGPLLGHFTTDGMLRTSCSIETSEHDTSNITAARFDASRPERTALIPLCARPS